MQSADSYYYPGLYQKPLTLDEYRIITLANTPQHNIGLNPYVLFDNRDVFIPILELFNNTSIRNNCSCVAGEPLANRSLTASQPLANRSLTAGYNFGANNGFNSGIRTDVTSVPITTDYRCNACYDIEPRSFDYQNPYKINKLSQEVLYGGYKKDVVPGLNCYQRQNGDNILMKPSFCRYEADGSINCVKTSPYCRQKLYQPQ